MEYFIFEREVLKNKDLPYRNEWQVGYTKEKRLTVSCKTFLVGEDGFEPSKLEATDLQSAPFGRSGILP